MSNLWILAAVVAVVAVALYVHKKRIDADPINWSALSWLSPEQRRELGEGA